MGKIVRDEISRGSRLKYNSIVQRAEELAKRGYGSVLIKLKIKLTEDDQYDEYEVSRLLKNEGFILTPVLEQFGIQTFRLIWCYRCLDCKEIIDSDI